MVWLMELHLSKNLGRDVGRKECTIDGIIDGTSFSNKVRTHAGNNEGMIDGPNHDLIISNTVGTGHDVKESPIDGTFDGKSFSNKIGTSVGRKEKISNIISPSKRDSLNLNTDVLICDNLVTPNRKELRK